MSQREVPMPIDRSPAQRGLIGLFYAWLSDPLNLDERDRFIDRFIKYELKARMKAEPIVPEDF
jgi:hypothetical protein